MNDLTDAAHTFMRGMLSAVDSKLCTIDRALEIFNEELLPVLEAADNQASPQSMSPEYWDARENFVKRNM